MGYTGQKKSELINNILNDHNGVVHFTLYREYRTFSAGITRVNTCIYTWTPTQPP